MKIKIIQKIVIITILMIITLVSCQYGRFIVYNFANISDHKIFPKRDINKDSIPFLFMETSTKKYPSKIKDEDFNTFLTKNKTVAFLVIKNDSIQYENYFEGYNKSSIVPSFSMAKSIISILIGCAIDDQLIKSVEEPIINYIPELTSQDIEKVTIKHLLQMTSGLDFNESYINPFGDAAKMYYGRNLRKRLSKIKLKESPGSKFEYLSGNSQILGLILERALINKTVTAYLEEKIWKPLGMEYDASWSIDKQKEGLEKTFCCINARARDYAKIGRLFMNKGNWNGKQIISENWVKESTKIDETFGSVSYYQYQWWITDRKGSFMAQGILGQYIYVNPSKNLIVVRLGKKTGNVNWWTFFNSFSEFY